MNETSTEYDLAVALGEQKWLRIQAEATARSLRAEVELLYELVRQLTAALRACREGAGQ